MSGVLWWWFLLFLCSASRWRSQKHHLASRSSCFRTKYWSWRLCPTLTDCKQQQQHNNTWRHGHVISGARDSHEDGVAFDDKCRRVEGEVIDSMKEISLKQLTILFLLHWRVKQRSAICTGKHTTIQWGVVLFLAWLFVKRFKVVLYILSRICGATVEESRNALRESRAPFLDLIWRHSVNNNSIQTST